MPESECPTLSEHRDGRKWVRQRAIPQAGPVDDRRNSPVVITRIPHPTRAVPCAPGWGAMEVAAQISLQQSVARRVPLWR
jgi:hypothetical protein